MRIWVTWAAAPFRRWQFGSDFPFRPEGSSYGKYPPFDNVNWRADRGRSSRGITNEPTILNADDVKLHEHKRLKERLGKSEGVRDRRVAKRKQAPSLGGSCGVAMTRRRISEAT